MSTLHPPSNPKLELDADQLTLQELRERFCYLSLLYSTTKAINDEHDRISGGDSADRCTQSLDSRRASTKVTRRNSVLHATISILVQNTEIFACMGMNTGSLVVTEVIDEEEGERYDADVRGWAVTAMRNPDERKDIKDGWPRVSPAFCTHVPVTADKDLWPSIRDSPGGKAALERLAKINNVSLLSHVATISSYLREYKSFPARRPTISRIFSNYISWVCWRKMHRRMRHWATIGMIVQLAGITNDSLVEAFSKSKVDASLADPRLAQLLLHLHNENFLPRFRRIMANSPSVVPPSSNTPLPQLESRCRSEELVLYDKDTVVDFHHLLVASLIAYATTLKCLFEAATNDNADEQVKHASSTTLLARLLGQILNSEAFRCHLEVLHAAELLQLPEASKKKEYKDFAKKMGFEAVYTDNRARRGAVAQQDKEASEGNNVVTSQDHDVGEAKGKGMEEDEKAEEDEAIERDKEEDEKDTEEQEFRGFHDDLEGSQTLCEVISGWMKSFISHYSSKRTLEHHCSKLSEDDPFPESPITLLAVGSSKAKRTLTWSMVESILKSILQAPGEYDKAIKVLKKEIEDYEGSASAFNKVKTLLKEGLAPQHFTIHCETALAAFAQYGSNAIDPEAPDIEREFLKCLQADLNCSSVLASKLCCPLCWMFLATLRCLSTDNSEFWAYGCHTTVFPTELPEWLPENVLSMMVMRTTARVQKEIKRVLAYQSCSSIKTHSYGHKRGPSLQSSSALSIGSSKGSMPDDSEGEDYGL